MGREVRRVPMDFEWPLHMVWKGYWNPYRPLTCAACKGTGNSPAIDELYDDWYGLKRPEKRWRCAITQDEVQALVDKDRLWDFTRVPINDKQRQDVEKKIAGGGNKWLPYNNGYVPTAEEVNQWAMRGMGHDGINAWICVDARAKRLGITETACSACKGKGVFWPEDKYAELHENFEWIDPPKGPGFQLWETTSEGSPISPVFETPEDLAQWLVDNNASSFGSQTESYEAWLKFIRGPGWAPSAVASVETGLVSGVAGMNEAKEQTDEP